MKRSDLEIPDEDPTGEEPAAEFDGTDTAVLDDSYRMSVVSASENSAGAVDYDDRGQPRWKWITEMEGSADPSEKTFDHLEALDNDALSIDGLEEPPPEPPRDFGYNPYDVGAPTRKPRK